MKKLLTEKEMAKIVKKFQKEEKKRRKLLKHKVFDSFRKYNIKRKDLDLPLFERESITESFWDLLNDGKN